MAKDRVQPCGYCSTGHHSQCRGTTQRWYTETRKGKMVIVYLDEYNHCGCTSKHSKPDASKKVEDTKPL